MHSKGNTCGVDTSRPGNEPYLSVSEAAAQVGLSVHTLRWYERIGLVVDVARDTAGRRRYRPDDVGWLTLLTRLRATGMPVRDMQRYAELVRVGPESASARRELLKAHRERVLTQIAALRFDLELIEHKIHGYCEAETIGEQPLTTDNRAIPVEPDDVPADLVAPRAG